MLVGLGFTDQSPDRALHPAAGGDGGAPDPTAARFASAPLVADLLAMLGQLPGCEAVDVGSVPDLAAVPSVPLSPMTAQLLLIARDAFMCVRARASEVVALVGNALPLRVPGATSVEDVAGFKARLLLHLDDPSASTEFLRRMVSFLHLAR